MPSEVSLSSGSPSESVSPLPPEVPLVEAGEGTNATEAPDELEELVELLEELELLELDDEEVEEVLVMPEEVRPDAVVEELEDEDEDDDELELEEEDEEVVPELVVVELRTRYEGSSTTTSSHPFKRSPSNIMLAKHKPASRLLPLPLPGEDFPGEGDFSRHGVCSLTTLPLRFSSVSRVHTLPTQSGVVKAQSDAAT